MEIADFLTDVSPAMQRALDHLTESVKTLRTGRANVAMLDLVEVDAYGSMQPLKNIAQIAVPESNQLTVEPWDKSMVKPIVEALINANLGMNPSDDGGKIRLIIPALTEERRKDLVKQLKAMVENTKVTFRNIRQEAITKAQAAQKAKEVAETDVPWLREQLDKMIADFNAKADVVEDAKADEIMTV